MTMVVDAYREAAGAPSEYWNPSDKNAEVTLSGGNAVATRAATASGWRTVRSVVSHSSGKRYFEVTNDVSIGTGGAMMPGAAPSALSLSSYPGSSSSSFGYHANSTGGEVYNNGSPVFGGTTVAQGSYARIAIDFDAGKIWFGNASSWKNSGDPGAGTGESFSFTPNPTLFAALGLNDGGQVCTLHSKAADIVGTIPSGFSTWE